MYEYICSSLSTVNIVKIWKMKSVPRIKPEAQFCTEVRINIYVYLYLHESSACIKMDANLFIHVNIRSLEY